MASHFVSRNADGDTEAPGNGTDPRTGDEQAGQPFAFEPEPEGPPRILWIAGLLSLVWLAASAAVVYLVLTGAGAPRVTLTEWAGIAAGIAAPLTAIWLVALVIARVDPGRGRSTLARIERAEARFAESAAGVRSHVEGIDALLGAVAARLDELGATMDERAAGFEQAAARAGDTANHVAAALAAERDEMDAVAERLAGRGEAAVAQFGDVASLLPDIEQRVERIGALLADQGEAARGRLRDVEDVLAMVETRGQAAAERAVRAGVQLGEALDHVDRVVRDTEGLMDERAQALTAHVEAALSHTADTLETVRGGLAEQAAAIGAAIEAANVSLDQTGQAAATAIDQRLRLLIAHADALDERFAGHEASSQNLLNTAENGFDVLEAKLSHATRSGSNMLDAFAERLRLVRGNIDALAVPIGNSRSLTDELERSATAAAVRIEEALAALRDNLPGESDEGTRRLHLLRGEVSALEEDLARVRDRAETLGTPVEGLRGALAATGREIEAQRASLDQTVEQLTGELGRAQDMLAETKRTADGTALAASGQLIEALGRVREVAQQAARSVQEVLAGVVDEAIAALGTASEETLRTRMLSPLREQIGDLEEAGRRGADAAQASAERLSRSLVSVAETAAAVEARVAEANSALDAAQRHDLAHQSNLIIEALNSASIDITKALSTEVTEGAWKQYLAGDRGVFSRRAARLVTSSDARSIVQHYEQEPEFRDAVRRYVHDFEAMMRRVMQDREGNSLSVALLSSDVGKLYVALAQAIERLRREAE